MYDIKTKCLKLTEEKIKSTYNEKVISGFGGFNGQFQLDNKIIVSSISSVGYKSQLALKNGYYRCIGQDIINVCANNIICSGAKPLYFLTNFHYGKLHPNIFENIMDGIIEAAKEINCPIVDGNFSYSDYFDVSGTMTGITEKIIDGKTICNGDVIIGLSASGLHTLGFELIEALLLNRYGLNHKFKELDQSLGDSLFIPTKNYVNLILKLVESFEILGIAHVENHGIVKSLRKILPKNLGFTIEWGRWAKDSISTVTGNYGCPLPSSEILKENFNLGIGMMVVVRPSQSEEILAWIRNYWLEGKPHKLGKMVFL